MSIENIVESICRIFVEQLQDELPEIVDILQLQDAVQSAIDVTVGESCRIFDEYVVTLENNSDADLDVD